MAVAEGDKTPRNRKTSRLIRLACWAIFLLWFTRFAYVRITTPPAAMAGAAAGNAVETAARIKDLEDLLAGISPVPQPPTMQLPKVSGWLWWYPAVLTNGVTGDWDPANDPSQRAAIKYITGPVGARLDRMVELAERYRRGGRALPSSAGPSPLNPYPFWGCNASHGVTIAALTFRSRYVAAEKGDVAAALRFVRAALMIAEREHNASYSLPQYVLARLCVDYAIPPEAATDMIAFLRVNLGTSVSSDVRRIMGLDSGLDSLLDRYYTRDENGDGWLVLSATTDLQARPLLTPFGERSRLWNVLSPLFHGRAVLHRRLSRIVNDLDRLDKVSRADGVVYAASHVLSGSEWSIVDGPLVCLAGGMNRAAVVGFYEQISHRRAEVVMLALASYRYETGDYPPRLDDLVPRFLDRLPLDANAHAPFVYERVDSSTYRLGSSSPPVPTEYAWSLRPDATLYRGGSYVPLKEPVGE